MMTKGGRPEMGNSTFKFSVRQPFEVTLSMGLSDGYATGCNVMLSFEPVLTHSCPVSNFEITAKMNYKIIMNKPLIVTQMTSVFRYWLNF